MMPPRSSHATSASTSTMTISATRPSTSRPTCPNSRPLTSTRQAARISRIGGDPHRIGDDAPQDRDVAIGPRGDDRIARNQRGIDAGKAVEQARQPFLAGGNRSDHQGGDDGGAQQIEESAGDVEGPDQVDADDIDDHRHVPDLGEPASARCRARCAVRPRPAGRGSSRAIASRFCSTRITSMRGHDEAKDLDADEIAGGRHAQQQRGLQRYVAPYADDDEAPRPDVEIGRRRSQTSGATADPVPSG